MTAPRALLHCLLLDVRQQQQAIRRLALSGMSDYGTASATKLNVQMVRRILGDRHTENAA